MSELALIQTRNFIKLFACLAKTEAAMFFVYDDLILVSVERSCFQSVMSTAFNKKIKVRNNWSKLYHSFIIKIYTMPNDSIQVLVNDNKYMSTKTIHIQKLQMSILSILSILKYKLSILSILSINYQMYCLY